MRTWAQHGLTLRSAPFCMTGTGSPNAQLRRETTHCIPIPPSAAPAPRRLLLVSLSAVDPAVAVSHCHIVTLSAVPPPPNFFQLFFAPRPATAHPVSRSGQPLASHVVAVAALPAVRHLVTPSPCHLVSRSSPRGASGHVLLLGGRVNERCGRTDGRVEQNSETGSRACRAHAPLYRAPAKHDAKQEAPPLLLLYLFAGY